MLASFTALLAVTVSAQLSIVARAPRATAACEPVEIAVTVTAPGTTVPKIGLPSFAPFLLQRATTSPSTGIDAHGRAVMVVDARYVLTTDRPGSHTIGAFEARLPGGASARSRPLTIVVRAARPDAPTVVGQSPLDTMVDVNFRAIVSPETVYVGQQANYQVAVFLSERVRDRLRRNPTFFPPDLQSMLAYDLPSWRGEPPKRKVGSRCFDALVFERAVFPLLPGRLVIPPAQLTYSLALGPGFFSREESRELRSDSTMLVAVEPPIEGRPADWLGAVGALRLATRLDTAQARVGNPLVLTLRVAGEGNVKLLPRPPLDVPWASIVPGDERVEVDTTAMRVRGAKEFDWMLTPQVAGEFDVPPVRYSYFDPATRRYQTATTDPSPVTIAPGALVSARDTSAAREAPLALRRDRGERPEPWHRQPWFWLLALAAPLPVAVRRSRRDAGRAHRRATAAARLRAMSREAAAPAPARLRRVFVEALAERLALEPEPFTREGALTRALRLSGVSAPLAREAEELARALDVAAYSPGGGMPGDALARADALVARVDQEALSMAELRDAVRTRGRVGIWFVLAALVAAPAAVDAQPARRDVSAFAEGEAAYAAGSYAAARDAFARAAAAQPRSTDAWANLGTAAWSAADTARAVQGWQRALRLDPLAMDVRERLALVGVPGYGSFAYVPPLPPDALPVAALLLWIAAWSLARFARGRPVARLALPAGVVAVALALLAIEAEQRVSGRQLAVVAQQTSLRPVPDGARGGIAVRLGEVVRTDLREGTWTHVRVDGGGDGWIEDASLLRIDVQTH